MKKSKIFTVIAAVAVIVTMTAVLTACNKAVTSGEITDVEAATSNLTVADSTDMFSERDCVTDYDDTPIEVTLNGTFISCDSDKVTISGSTITLLKGKTYEFTGTLTDGQIIVDAADKKVQIVLNNASITNDTSAALYVVAADKVFVTTYGESSLSTTGAFVQTDDNKVDGAVFSKDDIVFNGTGTLTVNCAYGNGIVAKDDLKITSGTYNITAANHGLDVNDSVRVKDGSITINSTKDGIHIENPDDAAKGYLYVEGGTFEITAGYDCIDAGYTIEIIGGTFTLNTKSTSTSVNSDVSQKGVKASGNMALKGGTFTITTVDDGLHSNASIGISGGTFTISSGDDGIHADSSVAISNGTISVTKSYEGIEGKSITISGGDISVVASDDGLNAAGGNDQSSMTGRPGQNNFSSDGSIFITISGGNLYVNANGDGIDSNGNLFVSGGTTLVEGPTDSGNGALDYDGSAQITGGTFVALGSTGMAMNFSSATQGTILVNLSSAQSAGSTVKLSDSSGNVLYQCTSAKRYQSVVISTPDIGNSGKYTINAGNRTATVSMSSYIYGSGSQMGGGMQPGGRY